jgi:hypothetical protein
MRGQTVLPCRPCRDASLRRCPHGHDISCPARHAEDDLRLGRPMCPGCYDYEAAVLFNFHAADLWRRFTTYLPGTWPAWRRHRQEAAGAAVGPLRQGRRVPGQGSGPLPRRDPPRHQRQRRLPPAPGPLHRSAAVRRHHRRRAVRLDVPGSGPLVRLGFGRELDRRPVWREDFAASGQVLDVQAVADYIAKYARLGRNVDRRTSGPAS